MEAEELLRRYAAGERDFRGVILQYVSLDGVSLEGVDFTGAIFNTVSFKSVTVAVENTDVVKQPIFTNCNFSCSVWWFCYTPKSIRCNFRFAVFEGCYFQGNFVDCDWKCAQTIGVLFEDILFIRCDFRQIRRSDGISIFRDYFCVPLDWSDFYKNSIDENGFLHSGIYCTIPDPNYVIPF